MDAGAAQPWSQVSAERSGFFFLSIPYWREQSWDPRLSFCCWVILEAHLFPS